MTGGPSLVLPGGGDEEDAQLRWVGTPHVSGPAWMKYPLLTSGMLGVQAVWTIEMSQASPYLIELGLSKSLMSLVFVAGPLSGLIMQPLIGSLADRSKSRFGRRRPFIVAGCAITIIAMFLLGWAKAISGWFAHPDGSAGKVISISIAIFAVFLVDFSVNAIMAADRALLVDSLPPAQQEAGNAWAGRLAGFGSVAGFWIGNVDIRRVFPFLGSTQLQALTLLTTVVLIGTHGLTTYAVKERVLISDSRPQTTLASTLKSIWTNMRTLPPDIRTLCFVQFFAWIGWFPVLFFTSVWVSDLYTINAVAAGTTLSDEALYNESTRAGSRALFFNAAVSFVTAVFLPMLIAPFAGQSDDDDDDDTGLNRRLRDGAGKLGLPRWVVPRVPFRWATLGMVWTISHAVFALAMFATLFVSTVLGANLVISVVGFCWGVTMFAPFALLGELILADSAPHANTFALRNQSSVSLRRPAPRDEVRLSVNDDDDDEWHESEALMRTVSGGGAGGADDLPTMPPSPPLSVHSSRSSASSDDGRHKVEIRYSDSTLSLPRGQGQRACGEGEEAAGGERGDSLDEESGTAVDMEGQKKGGGTAEKAGVILGIHNVFIVVPQFIITFLSSIIFFLLDPARTVVHAPVPPAVVHNSTAPLLAAAANATTALIDARQEGGSGAGDAANTGAVGFIFRFGGVSALVACYLTWRMMRAKWKEGRTI